MVLHDMSVGEITTRLVSADSELYKEQIILEGRITLELSRQDMSCSVLEALTVVTEFA